MRDLDEKQFAVLNDKLDKMIRFLALGAVRGLSQEKDKIKELDAAGFKPNEIDRLLGKTVGYSRVVLERLKEKKQPQPGAPSATGTSSSTTQTSSTPQGQQEMTTV